MPEEKVSQLKFKKSVTTAYVPWHFAVRQSKESNVSSSVWAYRGVCPCCAPGSRTPTSYWRTWRTACQRGGEVCPSRCPPIHRLCTYNVLSIHCAMASQIAMLIFPSVLWHCWLGNRNGIRPVESCVLVCWWWRLDWSFAHLTAPVVTITRHP